MSSTRPRLGNLIDRVRAAQLPPPGERQRIRREAGVTLEALANELGVTPNTAWRWEHGYMRPSLDHAAAYRALLDELQAAVA